MINTTDFLNALRYFEHCAESKHYSTAFKIEAMEVLIFQLELLEEEIVEVDLGEETPELFEGTINALKNL